MNYPAKFDEYVIMAWERSKNKTKIAKDAKKFFDLDIEDEAVRKTVQRVINKACLSGTSKRLFFDIETSFIIGWFWRCGYKQSVGTHQIIEPKKIICICYKWEGEDKVHSLTWDKKQNDKPMLKKFIKILGEADEIIGHNIDKFDMKEFRTRCIKQGVLMFPKYRTLDTLTKSRKYFAFESNRLDYIGEILGCGNKIETNKQLWEDVHLKNSKKALKQMVDYCKRDVVLNEDVFHVINPYIDHNTNFAVKKHLDKWHCPNCASDNVKLSHLDTTPMGYIKRNMKCKSCRKFFVVSNKTYLRFIDSLSRDPNDLK